MSDKYFNGNILISLLSPNIRVIEKALVSSENVFIILE